MVVLAEKAPNFPDFVLPPHVAIMGHLDKLVHYLFSYI